MFINLKYFNALQTFYYQNREILRYLFFGGWTFIVSMLSFSGGIYLLHMNPLTANVLSWVCAVAFAYITNRIWVFKNKATAIKRIILEIVAFFGGRLFTLFMEEILLAIGIYALGLNSILVKIFAQVAVIVSNYFISKYLVFKA